MDFKNLTGEMKQLVTQNNYEILYDKAILQKLKKILFTDTKVSKNIIK